MEHMSDDDYDDYKLIKYQMNQRVELAKRIRLLIEKNALLGGVEIETIQRNLAIQMMIQFSELNKWISGSHNFNKDTLSLIEYKLISNNMKDRIDKIINKCDEDIISDTDAFFYIIGILNELGSSMEQRTNDIYIRYDNGDITSADALLKVIDISEKL